jgi:hypothetical protein
VRGGAALDVLREPGTIRARCAAVTRAVSEGRSPHFMLDRGRLDEVAERVEALTRSRFPDGKIPYHSRWRHFEAGGVDRKAEFEAAIAAEPPDEQARARIDLTVTSVLLDAGAGARWKYHDGGTPYSRSEGLGVASFRAFMAGAFASSAQAMYRADAAALKRFDVSLLRTLFQVSSDNPLVGLEGRAALIGRLGDALLAQAQRDGLEPRPGSLYDRLTDRGTRREVSATALLADLLRTFAPIWRAGLMITGEPTGDCWPHRWAGADTASGPHPISAGWVPFHKLSQWLAYSLLEPFEASGVAITGLDALTALPEYRNGGLLIDGGVIVPRTPSDLNRPYKPGDELVVEWRALTVALIDELAERVRARFGATAEQMPLARILEGGTWAAGRQIAAEKRLGGGPPITIESDGTVF